MRGRIELVLDAAIAREYRTGPNPARWRGHLDKLLSAKSQPVQHHPALPYDDLPKFMGELRQREGVAARALEFTVLTACRTGEVINAQWSEIDDQRDKAWTIPAERMKAGKEHRCRSAAVPSIFCPACRERTAIRIVFIGGAKGKPLHSIAMLDFLRDMRAIRPI